MMRGASAISTHAPTISAAAPPSRRKVLGTIEPRWLALPHSHQESAQQHKAGADQNRSATRCPARRRRFRLGDILLKLGSRSSTSSTAASPVMAVAATNGDIKLPRWPRRSSTALHQHGKHNAQRQRSQRPKQRLERVRVGQRFAQQTAKLLRRVAGAAHLVGYGQEQRQHADDPGEGEEETRTQCHAGRAPDGEPALAPRRRPAARAGCRAAPARSRSRRPRSRAHRSTRPPRAHSCPGRRRCPQCG
jgi:hypothetical protein